MKTLILTLLIGCGSLLYGQKFLGGTGDGYATQRLTLRNDVVPPEPQILSYPTDAEWEILVQIDPERGVAEVELFDVQGRLLGQWTQDEAQLILREALSAAVYVIRIRQEGTTYMHKIAVLER